MWEKLLQKYSVSRLVIVLHLNSIHLNMRGFLNIYFGTVVFIDHEKSYMPLEFKQPLEDAKKIIK